MADGSPQTTINVNDYGVTQNVGSSWADVVRDVFKDFMGQEFSGSTMIIVVALLVGLPLVRGWLKRR